jgi:glyoxylate carboligase
VVAERNPHIAYNNMDIDDYAPKPVSTYSNIMTRKQAEKALSEAIHL